MQNLTDLNEHELLTLADLGKILKLKRTALYAAMQKGLLPPGITVGAGKHWRWRKSTVAKWLQEREEIPNPSLKKKSSRKKPQDAAVKKSQHRRGRLSKAEEVKRRNKGLR